MSSLSVVFMLIYLFPFFQLGGVCFLLIIVAIYRAPPYTTHLYSVCLCITVGIVVVLSTFCEFMLYIDCGNNNKVKLKLKECLAVPKFGFITKLNCAS